MKRKTFVSYYHKEDQKYKNRFINRTGDLIVNKSVGDGEIDSNNSDEYVKQLIQKGYLYDTTVLIVLIGKKTRCRKHIDWEIAAALNNKVGGIYAGLLGLILPTPPDFNTGTCNPNNMPPRFADNQKSGYAVLKDYTTDRKLLKDYIELAFSHRKKQKSKRINSRAQIQRNSCH